LRKYGKHIKIRYITIPFCKVVQTPIAYDPLLGGCKSPILPTRPLFNAPALRDENCSRKTRGMGLPYGENFVILASTVFVYDQPVWQTDGQTDGQ